MKGQRTDLHLIINKYNEVIKKLENQIAEAEHKRNVAYEAMKLLEQEGVSTEDKLFEMPIVSISEKYKDYSMRQAITDTLKTHPKEYLNGKKIHDELMKNGFKSRSKNLRRDVYIALNKLLNEEKIIFKKEGKEFKKYMLKSNSKPSYIGNIVR